MIDRITPATTDADRAAIAAATGLEDAWPVVTEPFSQWVVEDRFPAGRPDFAAAGVTVSDKVPAYERMKIRLLNGPHSTLAYLAVQMGREDGGRGDARPPSRPLSCDDDARRDRADAEAGRPR